MAHELVNLVIKTLDKHAPLELQRLNEEIYKRFDQLDFAMLESSTALKSEICRTWSECMTCEKHTSEHMKKLSMLRFRSCILYKKTVEHYQERIKVLSDENRRLRDEIESRR